jgi:tetratricopeptide (TPR) repeat protein
MVTTKAYTHRMRTSSLFLLVFFLFAFSCGEDNRPSGDDDTIGPELVNGKASEIRSPTFEKNLAKAKDALMFRVADEAHSSIDALLKELPTDIEAHALSGHADWLMGRYDKAQQYAQSVVKVLEPYVRENGGDLRSRATLSRAHMVLGDVARAEVQLRVALREGLADPYEKDRWLSLLIQRENLADQIELFETTLSEDFAQENPIVCAARGLGLIYLDRMDAADALLKKCLEPGISKSMLPQTKARLQVTQGLVALRSGQLLKARDFFETAIESSHKDADAHHALAVTMWRLRDVRARESLERALEIRIDPETAFLLGQVHTFNKRLDSAISQIKLSLDHLALWTQPRSTRWQVPFKLGRLLARKGQYARAQQALEQALELDPDPKAHREIYRHLVWVRQKSSTASAR